MKEATRLFGSCITVPVTKDLFYAVKHERPEYALFLGNEHKRELREEEGRKKRKQAEEIQKVKEKTKQALHEQLKE